ncbi:hypothetical protein D5086_022986, partial [Populus alba]
NHKLKPANEIWAAPQAVKSKFLAPLEANPVRPGLAIKEMPTGCFWLFVWCQAMQIHHKIASQLMSRSKWRDKMQQFDSSTLLYKNSDITATSSKRRALEAHEA